MSPKVPHSLIMSGEDYQAVRGALFTEDGCESFAVLFCGVAEGTFGRQLLVHQVLVAPDAAYRERLDNHLEISPGFINQVVDCAIASRLSPVIVHSHPSAGPARYSRSDDWGESRLLPVLQRLLPSAHPASLLLSRTDMQGRRIENDKFVTLDRLNIRGLESITVSSDSLSIQSPTDGQFDRLIRAVGVSGHQTIAALRVGVVGVGGTGSAVAEQLVRLGVRDLVLVDPDELEASNVPRVWGSRAVQADRGERKVDVVGSHLRQIRDGTTVRGIADSIVRQPVVAELRDRDLVFGCTDNHLSRAVLNRFAHQYLIPTIDMGVRVDARTGAITAAGGRVSLVGVGLTCLRCSGHIDPDMVRAESLPIDERRSLTNEGYIQGIIDHQPSVISLNTTIASLAVTSGLGLFVNLVGKPPPVDLIWDFTSSGSFAVSPRHDVLCDVCGADGGLRGLGDLQVVSTYQ